MMATQATCIAALKSMYFFHKWSFFKQEKTEWVLVFLRRQRNVMTESLDNTVFTLELLSRSFFSCKGRVNEGCFIKTSYAFGCVFFSDRSI